MARRAREVRRWIGGTRAAGAVCVVLVAAQLTAVGRAAPGDDPGPSPRRAHARRPTTDPGPSARAGPASRAAAHPAARPRQWVDMRNVDLRLSDQITIRVRVLHGEVLRVHPEQPATLDDPTSFHIRVTAGTVALTGDDLGAILNYSVFAYPGAPLRDIRVRTDGAQIIQTGVMHKGVDVRFRLRGTLTVMPDGRIRLHPTAVQTLGVNGEKVLHLVGLHLDDLLDLSRARGATVKGDDLYLDPHVILPPPAIDGRLMAIGIEGDAVVQQFARDPDDTVFGRYVRADTSDPNYIYFRGGELRFGKLLMTDTDLRIIDAEPRTPFDMSLPHYARQLVAGRSRTLANLGLVVYMPDFSSLPTSQSAATPSH